MTETTSRSVPTTPIPSILFGEPSDIVFQLSDLFVATALISATIAIVQSASIFGAAPLFIGTGIASYAIYRRRVPVNRRKFWYQFFWGIMMPTGFAITLADIPQLSGLFRFFNTTPESVAMICATATILMAVLAVHWFVGFRPPNLSPLFFGAFSVAAIFYFVIGILILPETIVSSLVLIGLPGFTPWFAAIVFLDLTIAHAKSVDWDDARWFKIALVVSAAFGVIVASAIVTRLVAIQIVP